MLDGESIRKIDRQVMNTRGELLFARCVVLFEGETEEQSLPQFAENYWGRHPNDVGIAFVSVAGSGNYLPFLRLVSRFRIPWVIFSDGEPEAIQAVDTALEQAELTTSATNPNCVVLPNGNCFEEYLVTPDSLGSLQQMMANFNIEVNKVTNDKGIKGIRQSWESKSESEILECLLANKTRYGARVAEAFSGIEDENKRLPACIKNALDLAFAQNSDTGDKVD